MEIEINVDPALRSLREVQAAIEGVLDRVPRPGVAEDDPTFEGQPGEYHITLKRTGRDWWTAKFYYQAIDSQDGIPLWEASASTPGSAVSYLAYQISLDADGAPTPTVPVEPFCSSCGGTERIIMYLPTGSIPAPCNACCRTEWIRYMAEHYSRKS